MAESTGMIDWHQRAKTRKIDSCAFINGKRVLA